MPRRVLTPLAGSGALYLHSMPGRFEDVSEAVREAVLLGMTEIVSLAPLREIEEKSPSYADALGSGAVPFPVSVLPVEDFGVPRDRAAWAAFAVSAAGRIRSGGRILVHCGAGIGRTGTFAECILIALGASAAEARAAVEGAGSHPETDDQRALVEWFESSMRGGRDA